MILLWERRLIGKTFDTFFGYFPLFLTPLKDKTLLLYVVVPHRTAGLLGNLIYSANLHLNAFCVLTLYDWQLVEVWAQPPHMEFI